MLAAFSVAPSGGDDASGNGSVHDAVAAALQVVRASGLPNETSSMFTTVPAEATFTSGVACAASTDPGEANAGAGSPAREQAIPEELLRGISTQLATPSEEMMDLQPTGDSIVLLTAAGDPLVLHRLEDDSFTAMQDGEVFSWMPTGEVATALVGLFNS